MDAEMSIDSTAAIAAGLVVVVLLLVLLVRWLSTPSGARGRRGGPEGIPDGIERVWTTHVKERMGQRGVTREQVEATLSAPTTVTHDPVEQSYRFEKGFAGEMVKVWVSAEQWPPRQEVIIKSTAAQRFGVLKINRAHVGRLIGPRGATIQEIRRRSNARIDVGNDGKVVIMADTREAVTRAEMLVRQYVPR